MADVMVNAAALQKELLLKKYRVAFWEKHHKLMPKELELEWLGNDLVLNDPSIGCMINKDYSEAGITPKVQHNDISLVKFSENKHFIAYQDFLLEKEKKRQHWLNQTY